MKRAGSFFAAVLALFLAACASAGRVAPRSAAERLAIVQGPTGESMTQVAVLHKKSERFRLTLIGPDGKVAIEPIRQDEKKFPDSDWQVLQARFEGLVGGQSYRLQVLGAEGGVRESRSLKLLDPKPHRVRFAVASCMDDFYAAEQKGMWLDLLSHDPEVIFLIGDNAYTDRNVEPGLEGKPATVWRRHAETRSLLELFRSDQLIPVFATWDDHDFGLNDGDSSYPHREASKQIFESFFPLESVPGIWERGPGLSGRLTAFGQQFYLMDDRMFRTPPTQPARQATHWGKEQEDWLYRGLARGNPPTWILNGDQFFGAYHPFESFERLHPASFRSFQRQVKGAPTPVVLISGDRHLTEIMEIEPKALGYRTYELTTSAIHAKVFPGAFKKDPSPRQIAGVDGTFNYLIIESEAASADSHPGVRFRAVAYGPGKKELFARDLEVKR